MPSVLYKLGWLIGNHFWCIKTDWTGDKIFSVGIWLYCYLVSPLAELFCVMKCWHEPRIPPSLSLFLTRTYTNTNTDYTNMFFLHTCITRLTWNLVWVWPGSWSHSTIRVSTALSHKIKAKCPKIKKSVTKTQFDITEVSTSCCKHPPFHSGRPD